MYTQRKSARAVIAPRADRIPETVEDEAPLNTGDALAELLPSVVELEPVPVLVPAPVPVVEEAVTEETLAVAEWMPMKLEGVAELMRVRVMLGRLEMWLALLPAKTLGLKLELVEPSPSPSPSPADTPEPGTFPPTRETPVSPTTPPLVVVVPVAVRTEYVVEVFVSVPTTTAVVCTGTDDVCTAPGTVVVPAVLMGTEVVPATTISVMICVVWSRAGQSITVAGHWVRVTVLVERIVEIV